MSKVIISMILAILTLTGMLTVSMVFEYWLAILTKEYWELLVSMTLLFGLYYHSLLEKLELRKKIKTLENQLNQQQEETL